MKTALIVGSLGQDGTYLTEHLVQKDYRVIGVSKQGVDDGRGKRFKPVDLLNPKSVAQLLNKYKPDEIYYLAAYHHSSQDKLCSSAELFHKSFEIHVQGLTHVLEAIKCLLPKARLFYAASSHVFGRAETKVQNEHTPFQPMCAYGISKTAGIQICRYYRKRHGVFASVGILYNHESPRRLDSFVTQKIVRAAVNIYLKRSTSLTLGNLNARVDWGSAKDYVRAMRLILLAKKPDDFVIASGQTHSIRDFAQKAFECVGLNYKKYVSIDQSVIVKDDRGHLQGDASKLRRITGWKPEIGFSQMIQEMVQHCMQGAHGR